MKRKVLNFFICFFALCLLFASFDALTAPTRDELLKAYSVYKLLNYIDINGKSDDLTLCHNGDANFTNTVTTLNKNKNERVLGIDDNTVPNCNIIFFSVNNKSILNRYMPNLSPKPVVTISDKAGFIRENGGIIEISKTEGKQSLKVNLKKAKELGIEINSKLVEAATVVY